MLLSILGAGASFDSVGHLRPPNLGPDIEEDRPPLAKDLFANRREFVRAMQDFHECKALASILRPDGVSVEGELAKIQELAVSNVYPPAHKELMAVRFYLQLDISECELRWGSRHHGITNYATLLREIERWRIEGGEPHVCFVTFNYDRMLEHAIAQVLDFKIDRMSSYSQQHYSILKLHGSTNWAHPITGIGNPEEYTSRAIINDAANLST